MSGDGVKVMHIAPALVATPMTADLGWPVEGMMRTSVIAEAALLPLRMSANALPVELVLSTPGN